MDSIDSLRPFTARVSGVLLDFIGSTWRQIQAECGVTIQYRPGIIPIDEIPRGNMPLFGAYDPERSFALTHYSMLGTRDARPVYTFTVAIYALGELDLAEFLTNVGMYQGARAISLEDPALSLLTGIKGIAAFPGNAWAAPDFRSTPESRRLLLGIGEICRAISFGAFGAEHNFAFTKTEIVKRGLNTQAQRNVPGVWWGDEERYVGYSSANYILNLARRAAA